MTKLKVMVKGNHCLWFLRDCRVKIPEAEEHTLLPVSGDSVRRLVLAFPRLHLQFFLPLLP